MRLASMAACDVRFQFRHGFYYAYLFVSILYIILLRFIPDTYRPSVLTALLFSDAGVLGFFFVGGLVILERGENMFESLFVTPLRLHEYLVSKVLSLTILALIVSAFIILAGYGIPEHPLPLLAGVVLGSVFAVLSGLLIASRVRHVNGYFVVSILYSPLFLFPILGYFGILKPLAYLFPPYGALILIGYGFDEPVLWRVVYAIAYQIVACVALFVLAHRWFARYVVVHAGDEE
jgi:fluoroquinolone transport system permease protein